MASSLFYVPAKTSSPSQNHTENQRSGAIADLGNDVTLSVEQLLKQTKPSVREHDGVSDIELIPNQELGMTPEVFRKFLFEQEKSFELLMGVRGALAINLSRIRRKVTIDLYADNLLDPRFTGIVDWMVSLGCIPGNITFELRDDGKAGLNSTAIDAMKYAEMKGFSFGVNDFSINSTNHVEVKNLRQILGDKIIPKFVKISSHVLEAISKKTVEVTKDVFQLFKSLREKGVKIISKLTPTLEPELEGGVDFF